MKREKELKDRTEGTKNVADGGKNWGNGGIGAAKTQVAGPKAMRNTDSNTG